MMTKVERGTAVIRLAVVLVAAVIASACGSGGAGGGLTGSPPPAADDSGSASGSSAGTSSSGGSAASEDATSGGSADDDASPGSDAATQSEAEGDGGAPACGADLLAPANDPSLRGGWPDVGVRTVAVGRLTVEVFYPAEPGSAGDASTATYDVRDWLPADQRTKVPDSHVPAVQPIGGDLYRDAPIDGEHGPYPIILAIHGTASFRVASGSLYTLWASHGFVVLAADYPGIVLYDELCATLDCKANSTSCGTVGTQNIPGDVTTQIDALQSPSGDLAFLAGHVDTSRIGVTGHSQGACVAASLSTDPGVQIVVPMAGSLDVLPSSTLKSLMFIAGMADKVIGYNDGDPSIGDVVCIPVAGEMGGTNDTDAYNASPGPPVTKRLVGVAGGGHLLPTDLCQTNAQGNNAVQEAQADGVCGVTTAVIIGLPALFDCGMVSLADAFHDVGYATTAAFEEALHCRDESAAFANLTTALPEVGDYQHEP